MDYKASGASRPALQFASTCASTFTSTSATPVTTSSPARPQEMPSACAGRARLQKEKEKADEDEE